MDDDTKVAITWAVVALVVVIAICAILGAAIRTTHDSHVKDMARHHTEMMACIASDRSAADCQFMVYGSW